VILKKQAEILFSIFFTKIQPNILKTISADTTSTVIFYFLDPKKCSSHDTLPLNYV
jgi:hypothetical protein